MSKINHPYSTAYKILPFFFKPFTRRMLWLFVVGAMYAIAEALALASAYPLFSTILNKEPSDLGGGILGSVSKMILNINPDDYLVTALVFFAMITVLKNLFQFIRDYYSFSLGQLVREKYSNLVYQKYLLADMEFLLEQKQGKLLYNIVTAPGYMTIIFSRLPITITEGLKLAVIFLLLVSISFQITMGIIAIGLLFYLAVHQISKKVTFLRATEVVSATETTNILVNESLNGFQQLRIYQAEPKWISAFSRMNNSIRVASNKGIFYQNIPSRFVEIFAVLIACGALLLLKRWMPGDFDESLPLIGVFFMAIARILPSLTAIGNDWLQIIGRLPYALGVYDALHERTRFIQSGMENLTALREVKFKDVHYTYPTREGYAIRGATFEIEPLKMTALVGGSGSGKSTIVNLLVRLVAPSSGDIEVNGLSLSTVNHSSWLGKIGYVSQDTFIFNASIHENISFGLKSSEEDVIEAAVLANAHEFITSLPDGYSTVVGDRGLKLSGGQRQRIAIARAVIRNPELLILDEATSSLDNVAEAAVQQAISILSKKYTVLVVAHRLNTIRSADKIIVLRDGCVIESGTHDYLVAENGEYARLYQQEKP